MPLQLALTERIDGIDVCGMQRPRRSGRVSRVWVRVRVRVRVRVWSWLIVLGINDVTREHTSCHGAGCYELFLPLFYPTILFSGWKLQFLLAPRKCLPVGYR